MFDPSLLDCIIILFPTLVTTLIRFSQVLTHWVPGGL